MRPNRAAAASTTPSKSSMLIGACSVVRTSRTRRRRARQQQRMFCPATSVENASAVGENRRAKPAEPSDLAHPLAPRAVSALLTSTQARSSDALHQECFGQRCALEQSEAPAHLATFSCSRCKCRPSQVCFVALRNLVTPGRADLGL